MYPSVSVNLDNSCLKWESQKVRIEFSQIMEGANKSAGFKACVFHF